MNRAQQKFGEPADSTLVKITPYLTSMIQEFVSSSPFAVLATASENGDCDASPKGGGPGFAKVLDARRLVIPDIAGNKLFQSYENVESNPNAALVFLIPGCDWTVRVNGQASVVAVDDELAGSAAATLWRDENTKVLQGLLIEVTQAYAHCPRAFLFSKLWDPKRIETALENGANQYWFKRYRESKSEPPPA